MIIAVWGIMSLRHGLGDVSAARESAFGPSFAQNKPSRSIYVLRSGGDDSTVRDDSEQSEAIQMMEFKSRHQNGPKEKNRGKDNVTFIEHELTSEDSLPRLALRFSCTIGQIKTANGLMSEQDLKVLRKIKIPVRKNGLLEEQYNERKEREREDAGNETVIRTISIRSDMKSPTSSALSFLQKMDKDLHRIHQFERKHREEEGDNGGGHGSSSWVLRAPLIHPLKARNKREATVDDGTICGWNWKLLLAIFVVTFIVGPPVMVLLYHLSNPS
eukprot:m.310580 g.310580  ORF g.310580 m.310580 type:complete len:272 (+) comp52773_c0_seq1:53-868(+)